MKLGTESFSELNTGEMVQYLGSFLRRADTLLICFPDRRVCALLEHACREIGVVPVVWTEEHTWKSLLKQAFVSHASAVTGPAHVILGLTKLAGATNTPLFIHDVVLWEDPLEAWVLEGIQKGLDCRIRKNMLPQPTGTCWPEQDVAGLTEYLLGWTSVLDFHAEQSEYGLSLEAVVFPGKKLPRFPSCARLVVRNWDSETDVPFAVRKFDLLQGKMP